MPKFVAAVNLSGDRELVYSNTDTFMRMLCSKSTTMHKQELQLQLQQFTDWVNSIGEPSQESFILITYQLPWQEARCSLIS